MKPHRTPLLSNAVKGSVRLPAQGPVVPAPAYAAHTPSSARPSADDCDPRLTNPRQSTALRERLSQTRARIARAHAERPPQINLDWDADEPLTRVYQGEKLPHSRHANLPAQRAHSATFHTESDADSTHEADPESSFAAPHTRPTPTDHTSDPWYSDLRAHTTHADHASEPSYASAKPQHANPTRNHAQAALAGQHAHAAQQAHTTPNDFARDPAHAALAQHAHATPADFARAPIAAQHAHATPAEPARAPIAAQHAHATPAEPARGRATRGDHARETAWPARAEPTRSRSFARAHHAQTQAGRTRVRAEQALTARVQVPAATPPQTAPREFFLPPSAASTFQEQLSTQRERLTQTVTSTVNALRDQLDQLYANVDRSDTALRKRVAYCSLGLLIVAAVSRIVFAGATSEAGASESSQAAATHQPAPLQKASVSISSDPPGALITLDGQTGNQATPIKLSDLAPGRHTISLKLAGYAETKEAVTLPADALVSIKLASLSEPRFAPEPVQPRTTLSRAEQRAQARELARERRAAARAAKVLVRYRARMGLPPDPVAQELVDAYGPSASAE